MNHTAHYRGTLPHQVTAAQMQTAFPGRFPATTASAVDPTTTVAVMLPGLHQDPGHVQYAHMQPFREQPQPQEKKRPFPETDQRSDRRDCQEYQKQPDQFQQAPPPQQQQPDQFQPAPPPQQQQQYIKQGQQVALNRNGRVMVDASTMTDPEEDDTASNWQNVSVPTNTKVAEYLSSLRQFLKLSTPGESGKKKRQLGDVRIMTGADGTRLFCCPECHVAYPDKALLEPHLAGHKIERRWLCGVCGAGLKRKEHLDRHQLCHSDERPFACAACPKAFKRNEHLARHYVIHSGAKAQSSFPASVSEEKVTSLESGSKGSRFAVSVSSKGVGVSVYDGRGLIPTPLPPPGLPPLKVLPAQTVDPSKLFASISDCPTAYTLHVPPVQPPAPQVCPRSEEMAVKPPTPQKAVEKKYTCGVCGLGHARREHLERHQVSHSEERPYACAACGKAFKRNEHLARHVAIHSGLKAHACDDCGKAFFRKDHLSKHLAGHHGGANRTSKNQTSSRAPAPPPPLLL